MILHAFFIFSFLKIIQNIEYFIYNEIYNLAISCGAQSGKLLGAGGAGFMLFYCPKEY